MSEFNDNESTDTSMHDLSEAGVAYSALTGDVDLSFRPFGADFTAAELDAIGALPSGSGLLLVRSGSLAGARYLVDHDVTLIGRHPDADIFLDDVTVSRRHAILQRAEEDARAFDVIDQRSLNGTYVNGEPIEHTRLTDGAELRIGKFRLNYFVSPLDRAPSAGNGVDA